MPEPDLYLQGFKIQQGMVLANHILDNIDLKHSTVKRYKEYNYPIVMKWRKLNNSSSNESLVNQLDDLVRDDRVINSRYVNPYSCHFGHLDHHYQEGDNLIINGINVCQKVVKSLNITLLLNYG